MDRHGDAEQARLRRLRARQVRQPLGMQALEPLGPDGYVDGFGTVVNLSARYVASCLWPEEVVERAGWARPGTTGQRGNLVLTDRRLMYVTSADQSDWRRMRHVAAEPQSFELERLVARAATAPDSLIIGYPKGEEAHEYQFEVGAHRVMLWLDAINSRTGHQHG